MCYKRCLAATSIVYVSSTLMLFGHDELQLSLDSDIMAQSSGDLYDVDIQSFTVFSGLQSAGGTPAPNLENGAGRGRVTGQCL